jgi:hypothetical protein
MATIFILDFLLLDSEAYSHQAGMGGRFGFGCYVQVQGGIICLSLITYQVQTPNVKALFFLRHYNDIDHVTPVVHKWAERGHTADVVLMGDPHFSDDYRIVYLASLDGVRVARIGEILDRGQLFRMRLQKLLLDRHFRAAMPGFFNAMLDRVMGKHKRVLFWQKIADILLQRSFAHGEPGADTSGVVTFDWISGNSVFPIEFVQTVVDSARERGLGTVSLPHGDSPHANFLVRVEELSMEPRLKFAPAKMFDRVVVPNELCATRFRPFVEDSRVAVLGSPRYCDEWLAKLEQLLPPSPLEASPGKLKVVMFLRKSDFSIFWDEVGRVVQMLAAFPDVELIIKAHTRGGWRQPLSRRAGLRRLKNVRFVAAEIHSSHLLSWSDVVIDIATSVAFEAVKLKKPVLAADYLHAGTSTVGAYLPECALHCRDDAYNKLAHCLKAGCDDFYVTAHRDRFLREIVDVPDADVLPRFVDLLESVVRR